MSVSCSGYPAGAPAPAPPARAVRGTAKPPARLGAENTRAPRAPRQGASKSGPLGDITNLLGGSRSMSGLQKSMAKLNIGPPPPAAAPPSMPTPPQLATLTARPGEEGRGERRGGGESSQGGQQSIRATAAARGNAEQPTRAEGGSLASAARSFAAAAGPTGGGAASVLARVSAVVEASEEASDPQLVQEYVAEIYSKLFQDEVLFIPRPNYMEAQRDINARMRAILVDWLVEVHLKYQLRIETLFLTVSLIDRYLARVPVMRGRLQLVGVVAMFIASKFEEMRPPDIHDFVYLTDNAYTKEDILVMECTLLTTLGFRIATPTVAHFLELLHRAGGCDEVHRQVAQYAAELALVDLGMVRHAPSHLAAAAVLVSNEVLGRQPAWPAVLARESRQTEHSLRSCATELRCLIRGAASTGLQAVRKKFSSPRYQSVATMAL